MAGVAMQQMLSWRSDRLRYVRQQRDRVHQEQHEAFVDLVKSGRRVQRALIDVETTRASEQDVARLAREVDLLTEAAVVVRLVVTNPEVLTAVEEFETHAKRLERRGRQDPEDHLRLTPLLTALQKYESRSTRDPGERERRAG